MRLLLPLLALLALAACYKPEIRQGNFLTDEKIAEVKPGMTATQVEFVLGPPMVRAPMEPNRWDYVRYINPNDGRPEDTWRVIVHFKDGKVTSVEQPVVMNKNVKLQLPTVKDASELPPDPSTSRPQPSNSGSPPPPR